jgi:MoxR-like ATPase
MIQHPLDLIPALDRLGYVVDEELATVLYIMMKLEKPLLLEGEPGVGKTEVANILASYLETDLIRLQCYEGLDVHHAIYEWNYQKQLLAIKLQEQSSLSLKEKESIIFGDEYLMQRPLLQAISADKPVVLLIDEIDRADEEFEAFLLEILSAFQISIPEIGTIRAKYKPLVILTSNRTRDLSDALKRRCLYYWVPYPTPEKELKIIKKHLPGIEDQLAATIIGYVQRMRTLKLDKIPGVAETIDWAKGVMALDTDDVTDALSCVVKSNRDETTVREVLFTNEQ